MNVNTVLLTSQFIGHQRPDYGELQNIVHIFENITLATYSFSGSASASSSTEPEPAEPTEQNQQNQLQHLILVLVLVEKDLLTPLTLVFLSILLIKMAKVHYHGLLGKYGLDLLGQ